MFIEVKSLKNFEMPHREIQERVALTEKEFEEYISFRHRKGYSEIYDITFHLCQVEEEYPGDGEFATITISHPSHCSSEGLIAIAHSIKDIEEIINGRRQEIQVKNLKKFFY